MKNSFYTWLLVALTCVSANAVTPETVSRIYPAPKGYDIPLRITCEHNSEFETNEFGVISYRDENRSIQKGISTDLLKEEIKACEVKCHIACDLSRFVPSSGRLNWLGDTEGGYEYWEWGKEYVILNLNPGRYDFFMAFDEKDDEVMYGTRSNRYVILENILVEDDMTLDFDPETANVRINFNAILANGDAARLPVVTMDENWKYTEEDAGNCTLIDQTKYIFLDGVGPIYEAPISFSATFTSSPMGKFYGQEWLQPFYVTPVSDRFTFASAFFIFCPEDANQVCFLSTRGTEDTEITNDPSYTSLKRLNTTLHNYHVPKKLKKNFRPHIL